MALNYSKAKQNKQAGGVFNDELTDSVSVSKENSIVNIDGWVKQILFWRAHIDIFIEDYLSTENSPINLLPFQRVIAREVVESKMVNIAASRGIGKTWLNALLIIALCILFPDNWILVLSKNVTQAVLTCSYIERFAETNENIRREIIMPPSIQKDGAKILFKNGSKVTAMALSRDGSSVRGQRAKYVFLDESILISSAVIQSSITPILNYKRPVWWNLKDTGFEDFDSTLVETTSAYSKGVDFFQRFKQTFINVKNGAKDEFVCAISCWTGVRLGMMDESKLIDDKNRLGQEIFDMEYNCVFIGNTQGSFYPYDLVSKCRTLDTIELFQPKQSTARYILILDVATSNANNSDNAALTIIKFTEKTNGTFNKQVVYLKALKGKSLRELALEIRQMLARFPSVEKVIIDANAIGEGIISLLQSSYVDPETEKEYPPLVCEDEVGVKNALPILYPYRGTNDKNNRGAIALKLFLENQSLQLPIFSADLRDKKRKEKSKELLIEELSVYTNADALLVELGYIKTIIIGTTTKYDTESKLKHKDRYSSLMMGCLWLYDLEENNKKDIRNNKESSCMGININW